MPTVESDLQAGAQYKYEVINCVCYFVCCSIWDSETCLICVYCASLQLLWIILLASFAALVIQSLASNLGVVTGLFPPPLNLGLFETLLFSDFRTLVVLQEII